MLFSNFEKRKRNLKTDSRLLRREGEMRKEYPNFKRRKRILKTCSPNVLSNVSSNAFVDSTVHFQMLTQRAWIRAGKVTLVAFFWLFSTVRFQMSPQMGCLGGYIITMLAFVLTFHHCVFSNGSSDCLPERMNNHTGCICLTFLHCVFSNGSSKRLHLEDA